MVASRNRRTEELRLVANPEGSRQGMFLGFTLGIEGLLGRWRDRDVSGLRENRARSLQDIPSRNRLCFDASNSSSKSWIAFGVIDVP